MKVWIRFSSYVNALPEEFNTDNINLDSIENISSKYEIERIICGITEDRIGVPISEIELHHSFTNDLGID